MKLLGFKLALDSPGRGNPWAIFLLLTSVVFFAQGIYQTHWLAYYRLGDSIIPRESDLTRVGPLSMSELRTRRDVLIVFSDADNVKKYSQNRSFFSIKPNAVRDLVKKYSGWAVAYLYVFDGNPLRKIWKVEVAGSQILSYETSAIDYGHDSETTYSYFWGAGAFFIFFLTSIIEVSRFQK